MRINSKPVAIYHAFDTILTALTSEKFRELSQIGFSHVQLPPLQPCFEYGEWHAKYQPTGYDIENTYGSKNDLIRVIKNAHENGIQIIADVILNHLGTVHWDHRPLTAQNWKDAATNSDDTAQLKLYESLLAKTYSHLFSDLPLEAPFSYFTSWNEPGWLGGALPQLNTTHPTVRQTHLQFLESLFALGVDGIRFDAIEHIHPESIRAYRNSKFCYGEIVSIEDLRKNQFFSDLLPITDFILLKDLISAFSYEGSLKQLHQLKTNGRPDSITFALNHDTYAAFISKGKYGIDINFPTLQDSQLATQFILARTEGIPLILGQDVEQKSVALAVQFRAQMEKRNAKRENFVEISEKSDSCPVQQTLLILERDEEGIYILNKSSEDYNLSQLILTHSQYMNGNYENLATGEVFPIFRDGLCKTIGTLDHPLIVPKRECVYLVAQK
jgi:hypothetical protein